MTAVALFDVLAGEDSFGRLLSDSSRWMAAKLVEACLADWARVIEYELRIGSNPATDASVAIEINQSLRRIYLQWAADAEQVLARTQKLADNGSPVPSADRLEDAFGQVRARLSISTESMVRAREQVSAGRSIPMKELHARVRAGR